MPNPRDFQSVNARWFFQDNEAAHEREMALANESAKLAVRVNDDPAKQAIERSRLAAQSAGVNSQDALATQRVAMLAQQKVAPPAVSLNPFSNEQQTKDLEAVQAADRAILEDKIQTAQKILVSTKQLVAADNSDANRNKVKADEKSLADLQTQLAQQRITQQAQMLQTMEAQWQNYFNIVNRGVINGVNGWISGQQSFAQATRQMLVQLLESFADYFVELGLKELESIVLHQVFATQYAGVDAAVNAGESGATSDDLRSDQQRGGPS